MRTLAILIALASIGCSATTHAPKLGHAKAPAAGTSAEVETVQREVEGIIRGLYRGDVDLVMSSTYPNVIRLMGGPEVARRQLDAIVAQVKKSGMTLESFSFPAPPEFFSPPSARSNPFSYSASAALTERDQPGARAPRGADPRSPETGRSDPAGDRGYFFSETTTVWVAPSSRSTRICQVPCASAFVLRLKTYCAAVLS